jgi:hypothetical protein
VGGAQALLLSTLVSRICDQLAKDASYLREKGMTQEQLSALHHFSLKNRGITYNGLLRHFGNIQHPDPINVRFANRVRFVADAHREGRRDFESVIQEALARYPLQG